MDNNSSFQKNIVYGNINAGGNVYIGDVYYNVTEDFSHSILFFRIEPLGGDNYSTQLTLKSRHGTKMGLISTGLPLFKERVTLTISPKLFEQVNDFQSLRRKNDFAFRKTDSVTPDTLLSEDEQLSKTLFDTFFKGDILTVCQDFVELLEKRKIEELLLAISVDDAQVVNLPFEMVIPYFFPEKLGQTRQSLAVNHFGLVRTLEKDLSHFDMQGKAPSAAPLKMLFVTALPENMDEGSKMLEIEEEQKRLIDAIGSFEATGGQPNLVIEFLDTASLTEISDALRKHQHDILHISGHGSYQQEVKQGVLHLEDDEGNHFEVTGATLGETLRQHQCLKLLLLSACETAIAGNGVVEQLSAFGVPAVVAMRFSVTDIGAKIFTTALYESLVKGETLTHAIATARESLWEFVQAEHKREPNRQHLAEWFTPVIYLNQYTEGLVNLKEKYVLPKDFYPHSDFLKTKNTRLIGSGFIGRKRYLNTLRRSFANGQHVCLHGLGGMGKTTLAEAFAHNYDNHNHEVIIFRNGNQIAEKYILDELFARLEADEKANKNTVRQMKQYLESDANPQEKLQVLIDNYLKNRKTILVFDNFEDVQISVEGKQQQVIGSASLAEFMTYLCQNIPLNCHLLFTTRYKIVDLAECLTHLALDKMTYAEQYRLTNFSETLRKIPMTERQDIVKRLDGHPRAYEFLETLLKKDKTLTWTKLSTQIGEVEAKVWEDLLLEKIYQRLDSEEQKLLQVCAVFISRTPITALEYILEKAEISTVTLEIGRLLGLYFYNAENQTFEVHRLTREWMIKNVIDTEDLKKWAFWAGNFFVSGDIILFENGELAREYFKMAETWEEFAQVSFDLQGNYRLRGFNDRAIELNNDVLNKNINEKSTSYSLNNLGTIFHTKGNFEVALSYLQQSLAIKQESIDLIGEGGTLNNIGQVYYSIGDYENSLKYCEDSLNIMWKAGDRKGEAIALNSIAQIFTVKGNLTKSLNYLERSLSIQQEIGDLQGEGFTLGNISKIYDIRGIYDKALVYLEKALIIQQKIVDSLGQGITLDKIGQIYMAIGNYDKALYNLEKSLEVRNQNGDIQGQGTTLNNLSSISYFKGNYDQSLIYLKQSLKLREQIGDRQGIGITFSNLAMTYLAKGDIANSLSYLEQSLSIQQEIGDVRGTGITLSNLGMATLQKGDFEKALYYMNRSLIIQQKIGDRKGEGTNLNNISQIYNSKGDYSKSLDYLKKSLLIRQEIGDIAGEASVLNNIGAIYLNQKNDFNSATVYFMQSYQINQKLNSPNSQYQADYLGKIIEVIGKEKFEEILASNNLN